MVTDVRIYMEGGGDTMEQAAPLREGLQTWIQKALPSGARRPKIIASGPRFAAYEKFCHARRSYPNSVILLLVDSEECPVKGRSRWEHVRRRGGDEWIRPDGASDEHLHFMAVTMETWLVADPAALEVHFGEGFLARHLPGTPDLEQVEKDKINRSLDAATCKSERGRYRKGSSFKLLGLISPSVVQGRCEHARTFVDELKKHLG